MESYSQNENNITNTLCSSPLIRSVTLRVAPLAFMIMPTKIESLAGNDFSERGTQAEAHCERNLSSAKSVILRVAPLAFMIMPTDSGTQREYSSKPLKHSIVKRSLVFKR